MNLLRACAVLLGLLFLTMPARASTTVEAVGRITSKTLTTGPWAGARVGEYVHMTFEVVDNGFIYDPNFPNQARRFDFVPGTFKMSIAGIRCDLRLTSTFDPTTDLGNGFPVADVFLIRGAGDVIGLLAEGTTTPILYNLTFELHDSTGTAWNSADMAQNIGVHGASEFDFVEWFVTGTNGTGLGITFDRLVVRAPTTPTGGCCFGDGWCATTSFFACTSSQWSQGVTCPNVECAPAGACCLPSGGCTLLTQAACESIPFAVYQGDGTACGQNPCPPAGACCTTGACAIKTQAACVGGGGRWMGAGSTCDIQPQYFSFPNVLLPDAVFNGPPGVYTDTITITDAGTITSIEVWVGFNISRINDLKFLITGPNGTTLDLMTRIGATPPACTTTPIGPGYAISAQTIFQDSAAQSFYSHVLSFPTGSFVPGGRFQASGCGGTPVTLDAASPAGFGGIPLAGTWTLTIRDERSGVRGGLGRWGLSFNGGNLPPCQQLCVADFDDGSGTGTVDFGVTIDDLIYYLGLFEAGDAGADIDDGSGTGTYDGGVTIDDLIYYLTRFEAGC